MIIERKAETEQTKYNKRKIKGYEKNPIYHIERIVICLLG